MPDSRGTIGAPVEQLELATVLKVSQAVSGEIELDKLVATVLRTAIEHAGAERGVLVVPREDDLWIQAEEKTNGSATPVVLRDVPLGSAVLAESVVRYAARAHETVNLDDASTRGAFSSDEYIRREHARSVLCLPLLQQGRLMALLYLENNLATGVFTPARMAVLNVLASQAAMSLEKTRLYQELQQREAKIRRLVDANVVGVLVANLDGQIIEANDAFLNMLGYSREDLALPLRWTELTPPDWKAATERAVAQIAAQGTCDLYEKEYLRKDGSRVPVLVAGAAIEGTKGETVAFVLDLTERKRAEQELAASRRRIVAASDEARRRIERDLHDGVQQQLVSLRLELGAMNADPPTGDALEEQLVSVTEEVGSVLEALVEIARGIHPAILSEGGLAAALRALARRSPLPVEVKAQIDGLLPDEVEVAAYYVASEALTNVAKHARASVVHIDVATNDGTLTLVVRDDGVGGADGGGGSGLVGLQDRVEALGGTITIDSVAGEGTCVAVTLPLATEAAQGIENVFDLPEELESPTSPA